MLEHFFYGYDFHASQPCARIEQQLQLGELQDMAHIDSWLRDRFAIAEAQYSSDEGCPQFGPELLARTVAERALALYGELSRASAIPSFDRGRVVEIAGSADHPGSYTATIALPVIDNMPLSWFVGLFRQSLDLVLGPLSKAPTPAAAAALFAEIERSIFQPTMLGIPFGKPVIPVCEMMALRNIPFRHLGNGIIRLGWGASGQLLNSASVERNSAIGALACRDKQLSAHMLRAAGLPAPVHFPVDTREIADKAAAQLGWPVVVKPVDCERSEGVTVNISSEPDLLGAWDHARTFSERVLVERQVPGLCHRIMVAGGQAIYAVKRLPKGVRGNGRDSVATLVAAANAEESALPPWKQLKPYPLDELALQYLALQRLSPESVPQSGQWAALRPNPSGEWGGGLENVTAQMHADNAQLALAAARIFGLTVAGIDLMTADIAVPWHQNGAVIIESNYRPEFATRYRDREAARLMPALVDGDGRIPVHLVIGEGDLPARARELKQRLRKRGHKCHLTGARYSEDSQGRAIPMTLGTLFERSLALSLRSDVEELILVAEGPDPFGHGFAIDRLETLLVVDSDTARGDRTTAMITAKVPVRSVQRLRP